MFTNKSLYHFKIYLFIGYAIGHNEATQYVDRVFHKQDVECY